MIYDPYDQTHNIVMYFIKVLSALIILSATIYLGYTINATIIEKAIQKTVKAECLKVSK
jgi:hypothetical protein